MNWLAFCESSHEELAVTMLNASLSSKGVLQVLPV